MTRTMYDSTNVLDLPPGADMYAGYVDGGWPDAAAIAKAFPGKLVVGITTNPGNDTGTVLDVENGDATPGQAPGWVAKRRQAGADPTVYCSASAWPGVAQKFTDAGIAAPHWWVAAYPGGGPTVPAGAVAHQYEDTGTYDVSVVADYWPGVDPVPVPEGPTFGPPIGGSDMPAVPFAVTLNADGRTDVAVPLPAGTTKVVAASLDILSVYAATPPAWDPATGECGVYPAVGNPTLGPGYGEIVVWGPPGHYFTGHALCA